MSSLNKVILVGNLGRAADFKTFGTNGKLVSFSLGMSEGYKDKSGQWQTKTEWVRCSMFGDKAEELAPQLQKGARVLVEGGLRANTFEKNGEKRTSLEVSAREITVLRPNQEDGAPPPFDRPRRQADGFHRSAPPPVAHDDDVDPIPF